MMIPETLGRHGGLNMAMTLRLSEEEAEALREQADREGVSMHEYARVAINERIQRAEVAESALRGATRYAEVLRRLADA
jgi:predicted transcriptional regulator